MRELSHQSRLECRSIPEITTMVDSLAKRLQELKSPGIRGRRFTKEMLMNVAVLVLSEMEQHERSRVLQKYLAKIEGFLEDKPDFKPDQPATAPDVSQGTTVASLAPGSVGFVAHDAIQIDEDRRIWLHLDARFQVPETPWYPPLPVLVERREKGYRVEFLDRHRWEITQQSQLASDQAFTVVTASSCPAAHLVSNPN